MRIMIGWQLALILALFIGVAPAMAGDAGRQIGESTSFNAAVERSPVVRARLPGPAIRNMSRPEDYWHGVHLCSIDSHCGSGHKCCSGHCKAVATCG